MAAIVNGGHRVRPYLNSAAKVGASGAPLSDRTLELVRRGLLKCVEKGPPAPTGTGHEAFIERMTVLGKTGSAQTVSLARIAQYEREEDIPKKLRDHAWFIGGVMDRQPHIAVCVLVEHGHHGGAVAAPLAKTLIEFFYAQRSAGNVRLAQRLEELSP